ncbi:hypothetical protein DL239_07665 [Sedimentitalea sp. CY04]|uniref:Uncharacterized protein n=1 Tax=Parasedimentitalea denitrificans TaxID=2211118 RepID=A0ABX0W5D2_9RHOB|nr:hypothetical protein [Sedimentitalea sp. CY04]NIZ60848.1 hypothetical protein [Sedimentitalea sp. CY04]
MAVLSSTKVKAESLPRMQNRFPYLQKKMVPSLLQDREAFIKHLATTHQLTLTEAREEVEDFLFIEGLLEEVDD